jgi:hypothetical protein
MQRKVSACFWKPMNSIVQTGVRKGSALSLAACERAVTVGGLGVEGGSDFGEAGEGCNVFHKEINSGRFQQNQESRIVWLMNEVYELVVLDRLRFVKCAIGSSHCLDSGAFPFGWCPDGWRG